LLLNCARQAGKTQVVAVAALDKAMMDDNSLVLLLSPSERQSKELFLRVMQINTAIGVGIEPESETTSSVMLPNGSRIIALPGKEQTIRGYAAVSLLIIDEAARVPDDLYRAVRPMLAVSSGRLICLSTPFGKRGFFHQEWTEGGLAWQRVQITAEQCPRISKEFLAEEKRSLPTAWYRQEYFCEFAESEGSVFSYEDIQAAADPNLRPLFEPPTEILTGPEAPFQ